MNIQSAMIEFGKNGDKVPAFMARPDDDEQHPGVIVIQEWWGLNDHIKDVTERMAREGYVAISPDLYRGQVALEPDEAKKLAMDLERESALGDIQAGVDYLLAQDYVVPKSIGIMGFCMGGSLSAWMATRGEGVGACVVFYGSFRDDVESAVPLVKVPLLGIFGAEDAGIPVESVKLLATLLANHGKVCDINIYDGAPHAFFNDTRPAYRVEAAKDAWDKTLMWFEKYLV